mmetsp:Transcript_65630/g.168949  ORF Transcript_65630/g.168949 Transcript_65630/m.168949 type:complete len:475 (+) Transcript_65630:207-1631(+)
MQRIQGLESMEIGRRLQDDVAASLETMRAELDTSVDTTWILVAGLICFFLQAGFGLLEAGAVRAKNTKSIMLKNLMDAVVGGMVYYLFGYGLAYGGAGDGTGNEFIGWGNFALAPASEQDYLSWFFQYVFAATIATIVSGAVAERIQFRAYMIYSIVLTGVIYPIASHWIWSADGFLYKMAIIDYAGGGAVHALSGVAALMAAVALGPRLGRFDESGKPVEIAPCNVGMMALGVFVLWFGFIPFNAGSGLSVTGAMAGQTTRIAAITTLGGCSGGITALLLGMAVDKHASIEYAMNGILAGMVSVCSCCAVVSVWPVFFIISPLGTLSFFGLGALELKFQVDDPLGASGLHFGPGMVGLLAVGFLAVPEYVEAAYGCEGWEYREGDTCADFYGLFYGGSGKQLGYQLLGGLLWSGWGLVTCGILFYAMKFAGVLRVSAADEIKGLDISHHGGPAYESPLKVYAAEAGKDVVAEV